MSLTQPGNTPVLSGSSWTGIGWSRIGFILWVLTTLKLVLDPRTFIRRQVRLVRKEGEKSLGKGGVSIAEPKQR